MGIPSHKQEQKHETNKPKNTKEYQQQTISKKLVCICTLVIYKKHLNEACAHVIY